MRETLHPYRGRRERFGDPTKSDDSRSPVIEVVIPHDPSADDPDAGPTSQRGETRQLANATHITLHEYLPAMSLTVLAALVLIPAPRYVAWLVLLVLPSAVARRAGRSAGFVAAATAALSFLIAHGRPRFTAVVTDQLTIRSSFVLGVLAAVGVSLVATRRARARQLREHADTDR